MSGNLYYTTHDSAIGRLLLVGSERGLQRVARLDDGESPDAALHLFYGNLSVPRELGGFFTGTCEAIDRYLDHGEQVRLPYDLVGGTALQRAVWIALTKIPYGETRTYSEIAQQVGFPRAVRAVASACAANPVALAIPCHRVVAKDGSLAGFSLGGVGVKDMLLTLEQKHAASAVHLAA
jgi:AraC family transcriptional regulator of adaptative response/methylated-DNA-[protein]-cysteine methyltransferase